MDTLRILVTDDEREMRRAVDRALSNFRVHIPDFEGDGIILRARGDETGEARSELSATVEGEAQGVALNTRLLTNLLEVAAAPQVELRWVSPQTPVVIAPVGDKATEHVWVVMPLHDSKLLKRTPTALQEA